MHRVHRKASFFLNSLFPQFTLYKQAAVQTLFLVFFFCGLISGYMHMTNKTIKELPHDPYKYT